MDCLSDDEIIQFFDHAFGIHISRESLSKPSFELLMPIFCKFLSDFGIENITQPDLVSTAGMESIDRYESIITKTNVWRCVEHLLNAAGMTDISIGDLLMPKKRKTNKILSLICILWTRLMNVKHHWNQIEAKTLDLPQRMETVDACINDLKRRVEERSLFLSQNKDKYTHMDVQLKELKKEYEQIKSRGDELEEEKKIVKKEMLNKKEELSDVCVEISQIKETIADLETKMVRSPQRIQSETRDKETQLEDLRMDKRKLEKEYMNHMRLIESLTQEMKRLKPAIETFTEALKDMENIRGACEVINEINIKGIGKEKRNKEMEIQLREHENSLKTLKQQMNQNEILYQKRLKVLSDLNNGLKMEMEKKGSKSDDYKVAINEQMRLEKELNHINGVFEAQKSTVNERYQKIIENFDNTKKLMIARHKELPNKNVTK